jgi:exodeoxyribonuclease VII small subunit
VKEDRAAKTPPKTFEEAMKRLEKIVGELESGSLPLAESLEKFEEGIALGKHCRDFLDRADIRIRTLVEGPDGSLQEGEAPDEG